MIRLTLFTITLAIAGLLFTAFPGRPALAAQQDILAMADSSLWVAEGANPDKPVYVIFSSACAYSRKMYEESQRFHDDYQFRWVPVGGADAGWLAMHGEPEDLAARIGSPGPEGDDPASHEAYRYNEIALNLLARAAGMRSVSYPVMIWYDGRRTQIGSVRDNLPGMLRSVSAVETGRDPDKMRALIAQDDPLYEPRGAGGKFSARSGDATVYLYPDVDSLVLSTLKKGYVLPQKGSTSDGKWAAVQPYSGSLSDITGYVLYE